MNQNRRRRNKERMTISEQLKAVSLKMCQEYCKYHDRIDKHSGDDDVNLQGTLIEKYCKNCPLREL